jgi:hypothetical protein
MAKAIDLTGRKIGLLTVVNETTTRGRCRCWLVICDCGTEKKVLGQSLTAGHTKSCGCLRRVSPRRVKHGHSNSRNGKPSKEYQAWRNAISRCHYPRNVSFKDYGAKDISVCESWRSDFVAFLRDMGLCPGDDYSLDRIDSSGNYEPGNCRWVPLSEQNENRTNCVYLEYGGERLTKTAWSRRLGMSIGGLNYWLKKGCTIADICASREMPLAA